MGHETLYEPRVIQPRRYSGGLPFETQGATAARTRIQVVGENIQSKGKIRRSFVLDAFPCQPQFGLAQEIRSSPNIFMASMSESDGLEHFRWKLMLWPLLGHSNTSRYALLIAPS